MDAQVLMEKLTFQGDTGMLLDWAIITVMVSPNSFGIWVKVGETQLQSLQKKIKHNNTTHKRPFEADLRLQAVH